MRRRLRRSVFALALALALPGIGFALAPSSRAEAPAKKPAKREPEKGEAKPPDRYDPDNISAISQYMETIVKGTEKYQSKDITAAIDFYKKAIQLSPRQPLAHYLLGEAYLLNNNLAEAEASFLQAQETSDAKNPTLRSHVLFAVADVYERGKKWEQAKAAWQAYSEHASKLGPDAGAFPTSGAERLKAIQRVIELEAKYVAVRQRIAAEKDGGADSGKK
jgi:Flp pilus assembly protein TadD